MFEPAQINQLIDLYLVPWGINLVAALLIFVIGRVVISILLGVLGRILRRAQLDTILIEFVQLITKVILLIFVLVAVLDKIGVNTTSLIAVLGAAGLAIGLALQGSLQNFAAGFMLLVLRPFRAGDFIEAAGTSGIVEKVRIFSTTLRTPDNKEVTVPNGSIYSNNIVNYSARDTRRVDMVFSISYEDDIRKAKDLITAALQADERVLPEPAPTVAVSALSDNSVDLIVRPWVKNADYWPLLWDMNEQLKLELESNGMVIPFPQHDVRFYPMRAEPIPLENKR